MRTMQRIFKFTLLAFATFSLPWESRAEPPAKDYELLFEDQFNGSALNESDWGYRIDVRKGGYFNGVNRKENVFVSGGQLHIAVRRELVKGKPEYTGGGVISKHQFGYGYYETLSHPFMAGKGVHTSSWQRSGAVPNNNIFEIDSYEIDSTQFLATDNLYLLLARQGYKESPWPHRGHIPFTLRPDGSFLDGYEYTPEGVIFYDNGHVVAKAEWENLTAAQCVWLTALNGCGKVDEKQQPGESTFDYFRFYAKDYPGVNLLPNGSFEYNQDKIDPAKPIAWVVDGDAMAVKVIEGDAAQDRYKLYAGRQSAAYRTSLQQALEFIRNGDYELTAMVRRSGGSQKAELRVANCGGADAVVDIPAGETWTRVSIPKIPVSNHHATISIQAQGEAGQWLEVDDIRFMKPAPPGQNVHEPKPFVVCGDPIWTLARKEPIAFTGDDKFYFFDRNVGYGDAITVSFVMNPAKLATTSPIERIPAQGNDGWAVQLHSNGDLVFRIGSGKSHTDVIARSAYAAGRETRVTCVFDHGTASIYANGKLLQKKTGIKQTTKDDTKPGKLGAVGDAYEAVGDVTVASAGGRKSKAAKAAKYIGTLRDVRIHNRALSSEEIVGMDFTQQGF